MENCLQCGLFSLGCLFSSEAKGLYLICNRNLKRLYNRIEKYWSKQNKKLATTSWGQEVHKYTARPPTEQHGKL